MFRSDSASPLLLVVAQPVSLCVFPAPERYFPHWFQTTTLTTILNPSPSALPLPQSPLRVADMVQGKTKGMQSKGPGRAANKDPKKGKRVVGQKFNTVVGYVLTQDPGSAEESSCCETRITAEGDLTLSAKINNSIERQMASAASSGKLTIMKSIAESSTSASTKSSKSSK
ncbi:hypothetical protein RHS04_02753 [Rhizoctonia solani]|uniref:Uncharacterized protein n=1 Tax=Rhizoctonia solani TaxID=456999 RepID=A0A8H7HD33_9AGAM|nr:hypothetical protein RHS04_02753 [Rhizoctonia solani]